MTKALTTHLLAYLAKNRKKPPSGEYGYMKPGAGVGTDVGEAVRPKRPRGGFNPARRPHNLH